MALRKILFSSFNTFLPLDDVFDQKTKMLQWVGMWGGHAQNQCQKTRKCHENAWPRNNSSPKYTHSCWTPEQILSCLYRQQCCWPASPEAGQPHPDATANDEPFGILSAGCQPSLILSGRSFYRGCTNKLRLQRVLDEYGATLQSPVPLELFLLDEHGSPLVSKFHRTLRSTPSPQINTIT